MFLNYASPTNAASMPLLKITIPQKKTGQKCNGDAPPPPWQHWFASHALQQGAPQVEEETADARPGGDRGGVVAASNLQRGD